MPSHDPTPPRPRNDEHIFNERPGCPGPELIAAYADGRRLWGRRRRLDAHFADCDRCFTLLAEVQEFQASDAESQEAEDASLRLVGARRPPPRWLWAGGGLATAAAILAIVAVTVRSREPPTLTPLIAAVGTYRATEARLVGFPHGPVPDVLRSTDSREAGRPPLAVEAVITGMQERASTATTPEAIHALGISRMIAGDLDGALQQLQQASRLQPDNPRFLSDLAAASLTRGVRQNRQDDLRQALDRATQAIARDGQLPDALFNRALALSALGDRDAARTAWNDYLAVDATSDWAAEARQHLAR